MFNIFKRKKMKKKSEDNDQYIINSTEIRIFVINIVNEIKKNAFFIDAGIGRLSRCTLVRLYDSGRCLFINNIRVPLTHQEANLINYTLFHQTIKLEKEKEEKEWHEKVEPILEEIRNWS